MDGTAALKLLGDLQIWPILNWLFESNFFAALFGAYFGAWAAKLMNQTSKLKDELHREVQDTQRAIALAHGIANTCLNLKVQQVRPIIQGFEQARAAAHKSVASGRTVGDGLQGMQVEFRTMPTITISGATLESIVLERLPDMGRAHVMAGVITQTVETLRACANGYNQNLEKLKLTTIQEERFRHWLGIRTDAGLVDESIQNQIEAMSTSVDSTIYFCVLLCEELQRTGKIIRRKYLKKFGKDVPTFINPNWSKARAAGLIPSDEEYNAWRSLFHRPPRRTSGRRLDKLQYIARSKFRGAMKCLKR